jgi:alpha/beta superfamily hydrolase
MVEVFFNSSAGRIEGQCYYAEDKKAPLALILHPHPNYGGNMNNKVVFTLYKAFAKSGFTTLRINFRGVGRSQGAFDNGMGELIDASTALDWLQNSQSFTSKIWVAGFSFGAWIASQVAMRRPEVNNFALISPPVNKYDFSFLSPCPIPGLIVHGTKDSTVPEMQVLSFAAKLSDQKGTDVTYKAINNADHFFRDELDNLEKIVMEYISEELHNEEKANKSNQQQNADQDSPTKDFKNTILLD